MHEVRDGLKRGEMWRAASLECNVKTMAGQCGCAGSPVQSIHTTFLIDSCMSCTCLP